MATAEPMPSPGQPVDATGRPAVDPTENVKALTEASVKRLDDLAELRAHHYERAEERRLYYESLLRAADERLRQAESDRIDAIRAVDVAAVQRSAEDTATRANTLAVQVSTAADVVRTTLATALEPIQKDIADLRRSQSEALGSKAQVVESKDVGNQRVGLWIAAAVVGIGAITLVDRLATPDPAPVVISPAAIQPAAAETP
jgi:hypothetical protein